MQIKEFIDKWCSRHDHPGNAVLHIIGIPATIIGVICLFYKNFLIGIVLIFLGYLLQVIGHVLQGSEVGEVMLIQSIISKFFSKKN